MRHVLWSRALQFEGYLAMAQTHLNNIEATAKSLIEKLDTPRLGDIWHLDGESSEGKSTTLRRVEELLREKGRVPIRVAPPHRALDAGQVALVQVAKGLKDGGLINGEIESTFYDETIGWAAQRSAVHSWLHENRDDIIVLCDEPGQWAAGGDESLEHFRSKTTSVIQLLLDDVACPRVVAGKLDVERTTRPCEFVAHGRHYEEWLRSETEWGCLNASATGLWEQLHNGLHRFSPLEVRLLVALAELHSPGDVASFIARSGHPPRGQLSARLIDALGKAPNDEVLVFGQWARCELVRGEVRAEQLERFGAYDLSERSQAILTKCIMYEEDDRFVLHELLRKDARKRNHWLDDLAQADAHAQLAKFYAVELASATDSGDPTLALREELEGFHHAVASGRSNLLEAFRTFFAEQLNLLGRHLSHVEKKYPEAVEVFERAVARDAENDYSHHYLAYNLDVQGFQPERVEECYTEAVQLSDEHAWWWSRLICFLLTQGRLRDAKARWTQAEDALDLPSDDTPESVYKNLHKWVARLALHRHKLDFAESVLQQVSEEAKRELRGFAAMEELLQRLRQAEEHKTVFPSWKPLDSRWQKRIRLPESQNDDRLARWLAARVEGVDESTVHLVVGERPDDADEPTWGRLHVPTERFAEWLCESDTDELTEGRFLELGMYGSPDAQPRAYLLPQMSPSEKDLPPLFPDPSRYSRHRE